MAQTILAYLRDNLGVDGDFMKEYRQLPTADKDALRHAATHEMGVLGIEITVNAA